MRAARIIAASALLMVWGLAPATAQKVPPKPPPPPKPAPHNANKGGKQWAKVPQPDPVDELRAFQKMSPEERKKELAKLPPQRRAHIEQQMQKLDSMTPEARERLLDRMETMQHLSPERRQAVNDEIQGIKSLPTPLDQQSRLLGEDLTHEFTPEERKVIQETFPGKLNPDLRTTIYLQAIKHLAPERQHALNAEVQAIRTTLPSGEPRRAALFSPEFERRFSPEEQRIIRGMFPVAEKGPPRE